MFIEPAVSIYFQCFTDSVCCKVCESCGGTTTAQSRLLTASTQTKPRHSPSLKSPMALPACSPGFHTTVCAAPCLATNDGALQHGVAQLKRIRRIVDAVNHALEGHRFITLAATRIAIQYGIEIVRALQSAHLRLFGVANLQIRMQCLFVRQWLVAIVAYGKRHRQFMADLNGVNGMKLRIRARNKLGKYVCVDLTRIQRVAQTSSGGPFLVIMPETVAGKTVLRCLRSHMAVFKTGIEPRENNGNAATDGSAFLKVNRLGAPDNRLFAGGCPGKHMRTVIAD